MHQLNHGGVLGGTGGRVRGRATNLRLSTSNMPNLIASASPPPPPPPNFVAQAAEFAEAWRRKDVSLTLLALCQE
jgi:hypothetical protein